MKSNEVMRFYEQAPVELSWFWIPQQPLLSPAGLHLLTGGSPVLLAAPAGPSALCPSSDPHTSTFLADHHVQDGTAVMTK